MANIFNLVGNVFVETEKAEGAINKITNKGKEADVTLGQKFGNIAKSAVAIGTAVVGAATVVGGAMFKMVNDSANSLDAIDKASQRAGMGAVEYQKWAHAANLSGIEVGKLEVLMKKQQTTFSDAAQGGKAAAKAYKDLGVNIDEWSSEEAFEQVVLKLSMMEDETKRNALANDIFGKSYADMIPMLNSGADGISQMRQEAEDLGLVMGEDAVKAGANFNDSMTKLQGSFKGITQNLMVGLMPIAQQIIDTLIEFMPQISTMFQSMAPILASVFTQLVPPLINLAQMLLPTIIDLVNMVIPVLVEIFEAIMPIVVLLINQFLPPLMDLIKTILPVLMPLLRTFASVFSAVLTPAIKILGSVVKGLVDIFKNVFGSLWEIVKAPINWIIGGINKFIEGLNKIKIPDWVPLLGGKGLNIPLIRKLQIGLDYVPSDNYVAALHKGEGVLTAEENKAYQQNKQGASIDYDLLAEAFARKLRGMSVMLSDEKVGEFVDLRVMKGAV